MTTPSVVSYQTWRNTLVTTSHGPISLPPSYAAGDVLLCVFSVDAAPTCTASTGWTRRANAAYTTEVKQAVFIRTATGSDPQLTVTTTSSEMSSAITFAVRNTSESYIGVSSAATGDSTNPNPPSLSSGELIERLWFATLSSDRRVVATSPPSGYTSMVTYQAASVEGASTSVAYRIATASTEDPGQFAAAQEQWVSYTLACSPLPEASPSMHVLVDGPLGAYPSVLCTVYPVHDARILVSGPLGSDPEFLCTVYPVHDARILVPGPLGASPTIQVMHGSAQARVAVSGPLGRPSIQLSTVLEEVQDDRMIIEVYRGTGLRPGGEIRDPLIGIEDSTALARGKAELNKSAHDRLAVTLSMAYRGDLSLGGLVSVTDSVTAQTWVGQITGISHQIDGTSALTTLTVDRPI